MPHDFVSFVFWKIEKIVWCISVIRNYNNLKKNNHKFQETATERCTSLCNSPVIFQQNPLKVPVKKLNLKKNFTTHELLHQWLLRFLVRFFSLICRSLFVSYMAGVFCIRVYICKKYFFPLLLLLRESKISLTFWITFAAWPDQFT